LDLPPTPEKAREGHILLIEALRHGDVEAAEAAVVENIVVSRDAALKKVAERPEEWPL
jgi:DNA-binding GntR family transcriptional regulator